MARESTTTSTMCVLNNAQKHNYGAVRLFPPQSRRQLRPQAVCLLVGWLVWCALKDGQMFTALKWWELMGTNQQSAFSCGTYPQLSLTALEKLPKSSGHRRSFRFFYSCNVFLVSGKAPWMNPETATHMARAHPTALPINACNFSAPPR